MLREAIYFGISVLAGAVGGVFIAWSVRMKERGGFKGARSMLPWGVGLASLYVLLLTLSSMARSKKLSETVLYIGGSLVIASFFVGLWLGLRKLRGQR